MCACVSTKRLTQEKNLIVTNCCNIRLIVTNKERIADLLTCLQVNLNKINPVRKKKKKQILI